MGGPPSNKELARKLRILAKSTGNKAVKDVLCQSADRLEKPGHKQTPKRAAVLYSVWNNKEDNLIGIDLPEKECLDRMKISHAAFMKAIRTGSKKWKIEKRFADEPEDSQKI